MNRAPEKRNPPGGRACFNSRTGEGRQEKHSANRSLPNNWRDRLPPPAVYYGAVIERLSRPNATGWAQGKCPLHDDSNASLSVHVSDERGCWRCFAGCGGGDMVSFHMRRTGLAFREAVRDLLGVRA